MSLHDALFTCCRLHFPVFGGSGRVMPKDMTFSGYNVPKGVSYNSAHIFNRI